MSENQVFETFNCYPWDSDKQFQEGYQAIANTMPEEKESLRLLKAKHFYYSKFKQPFDLKAYLDYEKKKALDEEALFSSIEDYHYEDDEAFIKGLPHIIYDWVEQQKEGLWDIEKFEFELAKTRAFYYYSKVQSFDLMAYFKWKTKNEDAKKPVCPFANLWQNKGTVQNIDQVNDASFIVTEKPRYNGPIKITLSSPTTKNIFTIDRIRELESSFLEERTDNVTSIFITATAYNDEPFQTTNMIQTKDTKILTCGLAYQETSTKVSGADLREISLNKLANAYYSFVERCLLNENKLIVSFVNGYIPLNAVYLILPPRSSLRLITEHALLDIKLELSHAPIPPLGLIKTCKMTKELYSGLDLYLALAAPTYSKLRGPELLYLGLADVFVSEAKLSDAFDIARLMAVCPEPYGSVQLALGTRHTYAGPNRLSVWKDQIENVFGKAESFEDLKNKLTVINNTWSKTILDHWNTIPPVLLRVIFRAVKQIDTLTFKDLLALEQKLNSKWRQTENYKEWLRSKNNWIEEDEGFYFQDLELPSLSEDEAVVYQVSAEPQQQENRPLVCPVTGQVALSCPVSSRQNVDLMTACPI
ncbi:hypothetical protein G6F43_011153 [Rhizopus delemar]|nr:hypothetical protein G6F43_011153 [Rhizopus delemar]